MLLLRIIRARSRWSTPPEPTAIDDAASDFGLRPGEAALSVYRVDNDADAHAVALAWAVEMRSRNENADYIVFDEASLEGIYLMFPESDDKATHHLLRDRHCALYSIKDDAPRVLAARLLGDRSCTTHRIPRAEVGVARGA